MKKSLSKIIFIIPFILSTNSFAEYTIKIPLEEVNINNEVPSDIIGDATLSQATINRGESSSIVWDYQYADQVNISSLGSYGNSGSETINPLRTTTYTVNATNSSDSVSKTLTLSVIQPIPSISFTSDKTQIGVGQPVSFNWTVSNAESINISNIGNNLSLAGNETVFPTTDTTYNLVAVGYESSGNVNQSISIDVIEDSIINSFNASKTSITKGESVLFNWNVSDSEGLTLTPFGSVSGIPTGSQNVVFNSAGTFNYSLKSTNFNGTETTSSGLNINVYEIPKINLFEVNNEKDIYVTQNDILNFIWNTSDSNITKLNGDVVAGTSLNITATNVGSSIYTLEALNQAGYIVSDEVTVNIVNAGSISSFTGPNTVFINEPFSLNWTGANILKYEIRSNNVNSGVSTTTTDIGTATNRSVTPVSAGTYNYTLDGYNEAESKSTLSKTVVAESLPTFTGFTVNGETTINVAPSTALTFLGTGFSSGATLQGRNSAGTANAALPTTASASAGTTTYYASATKTLNSISKYSALRNVVVNVINAPTIGTITAPTNVFANAVFNISWSGTNVTNYKIKGNVAASGITTTDVDLATATTRAITPTAAGTYTYTITATNSAGVITTSTSTVIVEADPTFTGFTVNGGTTDTVAPSAALVFAGTGFSSGATIQGRNSAGTANAALPTTASASVGSTTYYASATKSLNSITRYSALRSVAVTVVANPTISAITAPSPVFANASLNMSWSGTNVTSYKIRGNVAASGVATTDVALATATTRAITPTAAGTYTYTVTATNAAGATATSTKTIVVEADPTYSGFNLNGNGVAVGGTISVTVAPGAQLTFSATKSSGAVDFLVMGGNITGMSQTAPATAGTYQYSYASYKELNGVGRLSPANATINVIVASEMYSTTAPKYYVLCYDDGDVQGITMIQLEYYWNNVLVSSGRRPGICVTGLPSQSPTGYSNVTKKTATLWSIKKQ